MCTPTADMPNICFDPRVELTHALEHLRQASAAVTRAIPRLEGTQAGPRGAEPAAAIHPAATACAGIIDNLDGHGDEPVAGRG